MNDQYDDQSADFETERRAWREVIAAGYTPEGDLDFLSVAALDAELEALSVKTLLMLARNALLCLAEVQEVREKHSEADFAAGHDEALDSVRERIHAMLDMEYTDDQKAVLEELFEDLE
ncbi:hypothetical protein FBQ95_16960 [Chloroflexi bacterium CFX3]|nr:hypothetical protein [Chloroflexi bacterium CFX3]